MSLLNDIPLTALHYYLTAPYPCSYLPHREARSLVAAPTFLINMALYSRLMRQGFRRSGTHTYRAHCDNCNACVSLRVKAADFTPNRSQLRAWKRHAHLEATLHPLQDQPEYFDLYQRYQSARHRDGGMDDADPDAYRSFLLQSHVETLLVEFRDPAEQGGTLRMVSVIDLLDDGLSAVYTFYDPELPQARLGVYNILWQIELCRKLELDYLYLGYWIAASRKMSYKIQYQPAEGLVGDEWIPISKEPLR